MRNRIAALVVFVLALAGCVSGATSEEIAALDDIEVEQLAVEFNAGVGSPRLVLLLSPT